MKAYEKLLLQNKAWVQEKLQDDSSFFDHLAEIQKPDFLWIGCADSRVPANQITGTEPGEMFVHRNIANVIDLQDLNMLSVLQYAVSVLKVKHIIVCGHYGCGGIKAAISKTDLGFINKWLLNIKDVYAGNRKELDQLSDRQSIENRMVEFNVIHGVRNLVKTSIIQKAWKENQSPMLHGWVYDLHDGILKDIIRLEPGVHVDDIYLYNFD
jgi:carbonic anhydrase